MSKMNRRILINASNLHGGGGVAVASSFIYELTLLERSDANISLLISSEVDDNLKLKGVKESFFSSYKVKNYYGISAIWKGLSKEFIDFELVFTVFGPAYFLHSKVKHIFGFAQPWIIYPNNPISRSFNIFQRLKIKLHYFVQSLFFSRADELIVELNHVKIGLKKYSYLKKIPTHIVFSAVDSVFHTPNKWQPVNFPKTKDSIKLGVIARNYHHKNLACLPEVKKILWKKYNLNVDFFVTFSDEEMQNCDESFQQNIYNIGILKLDQCPNFYFQIDAVIFPTLLECFSATPFESMIMGKKLIASNLPFIKDCSLNYADYFDPLNTKDIANTIAMYFTSEISDDQILEDAKEYVRNFSSAKDRAEKYLNIILNALNKDVQC